jgi:hypothetical protein
MKQRLVNVATAVSLLLAVASASLWALSYSPVDVSAGQFGNFPFGGSGDAADNFRLKAGGYGYAAWARDGMAHFYWQELRSQQKRLTVGSTWAHLTPQDASVPGFALKRAPGGPGPSGKPWARQGILRVPLWSVVALSLALPAASARRAHLRRREPRRRQRGLWPSAATTSTPPPPAAPSAATRPLRQRTLWCRRPACVLNEAAGTAAPQTGN